MRSIGGCRCEQLSSSASKDDQLSGVVGIGYSRVTSVRSSCTPRIPVAEGGGSIGGGVEGMGEAVDEAPAQAHRNRHTHGHTGTDTLMGTQAQSHAQAHRRSHTHRHTGADTLTQLLPS